MAKYDLLFEPALMNAAGSLGFAPDPHGAVDLGQLGLFVTNPISPGPRTPANGSRYLDYPGGFLLHSGHPNPGLSAVLRRYRARWERSPIPVLVHLLAQDEQEVFRLATRMEGLAGVIAGLELGLPPQVDLQLAVRMTQNAIGELPVVVRLPLEQAEKLGRGIAQARVDVAAFSLGPPRGALPSPQGDLIHGRLYGPAIFPLAMEALLALKETGIPVIAAGGVYSPVQTGMLLDAGAIGVQLDAVLWRGGYFR